MHARHPRDQLRARQNHTAAAEDIVDQIQEDEQPMCIFPISDLDDLERRVRVRDSQLGHYAEDGHHCDLEGEATCPPDGECDTPLVGVGGGEDALINPHPETPC